MEQLSPETLEGLNALFAEAVESGEFDDGITRLSNEDAEAIWTEAMYIYLAAFDVEPELKWDWKDSYVLMAQENEDMWVSFILYPRETPAWAYAHSRGLEYISQLDSATVHEDLADEDIQGEMILTEDGGFYGYIQKGCLVLDVGSATVNKEKALAVFVLLSELVLGEEVDWSGLE